MVGLFHILHYLLCELNSFLINYKKGWHECSRFEITLGMNEQKCMGKLFVQFEEFQKCS